MQLNEHVGKLRFSYFHNPDLGIRSTQALRDIDFINLIDLYCSDEVKEQTHAVRTCIDPEQKANLKKGLPMITANATFKGCSVHKYGRSLCDISGHNDHLLVIDIDGLSNENEARQLQKHFARFECCILSAVSAKGLGVKTMILTIDQIQSKTETTDNYRYYLLKHNADRIKASLRLHKSINLDAAQFNITQPYFLSFDPELYFNTDAKPRLFSFDPYIEEKKTTIPGKISDVPKAAGSRIETYIRKAAGNIAEELRSIGKQNAARHPNIAKVNNAAALLHYAPQITNEIRDTLLNAVCDMYGGEKDAEEQNAINSFYKCWNNALDLKTKNKKIEEIIEDINTTTK